MRNLALFLTLALMGCASSPPSNLVKIGGTKAQRQLDWQQCDYEASQATATIRDGIEAGVTGGVLLAKCMQARGYGSAPEGYKMPE